MFDAALLIPVIAILATFSVPVTALIVHYKRRRLQSEERRAMIEKGMEPPPYESAVWDASRFGKSRDPEALRARSLHSGTTMLMLGIGLGVAFCLLQFVVEDSFIPKRLAGGLAIGASVVTFLGLGNLLYYAVSGKKSGDGQGG